MGQSPDEIRHDIERTREGMDETLDHIEDRVTPSRIVERRTARVRGAWSGVRDKVMGSAEDARRGGSQLTDDAGARLDRKTDELSGRFDEATDEMGDRLQHAQQVGKEQYRGNPLAAGLIAFGAGALLGSLLPETEKEHQLAEDVKGRLEPVAQDLSTELKSAGQDLADDLKHEAQDAVEHTKQTAAQAADAVKQDATSSAEHVRDESRGRAEQVKDEASS